MTNFFLVENKSTSIAKYYKLLLTDHSTTMHMEVLL